ncbi:MAG: site-specific integrase [Verrucomicrobiota bacterium]
MTTPAFPITVKRGSVSVKIYHTPTRKWDSYTVTHYQDGKRIRALFSDLGKARTEAESIATRLGNVEADVLTLTSADRAGHLRARYFLDPLGIPIETAAMIVAEAVKKLGKTPIMRAVDYYVQKHPVDMEPMKTAEVVKKLMELKEKDGLSADYLRHLRTALRLFAEKFNGLIEEIQGSAIDAWLREQKWGPRTRNNIRTSIQTLFNFAVARRYLAKDHDELNAVALAKDRAGAIEIFTPAEMREILTHAPEGLVPFLAIGAFAGIRSAEIQRLRWQNIQLEHDLIEIRADDAKTASRRTVPILPNLKAWLEVVKDKDGLVCPYATPSNAIQDLVAVINKARKAERVKLNPEVGKRKKAAKKGTVAARKLDEKQDDWKFKWKHNALRHSFISYRVAEVKNVAEVALEAGNSPQMIFKHYRELVRPDAAKAWFSIKPETLKS